MTTFVATIMAMVMAIMPMGYKETTIITDLINGTREVFINDVLVEEQIYNYELGEWEVID